MSFLRCLPSGDKTHHLREAANTCSKYCPSNIRFSKIRLPRYCYRRRRKSAFRNWDGGLPIRRRLPACPTYGTLTFGFFAILVGLDRIELSTSPLSGVRSSQLSYRPNFGNWWSWSGSNRRPPECKSGALPAELQPLVRSGAPLYRVRRLRDLIEASWIQGSGTSSPQPLSDSLLICFKWRSGSVLIIASQSSRRNSLE